MSKSKKISPPLLALPQLLEEAQRARREGRYAGAQAQCEAILAAVPGQREALLLLATLKREAGDHVGTLQLLDPHLRQRPDDIEALCGSAIALRDLGHGVEAERRLLQALAIEPRHVQANRLLGSLFERQGMLGKAEYHLRLAHMGQPAEVTICRDLGVVLQRMGLHDEAERLFRIALGFRPDYLDALLSWARMEEARNQLDRAEALLQQALALNGENPVTWMLMGLVQRRRKRTEEAEQSLKRVDLKRMQPGPAMAYHFELGTLFDQLGRFDEAFAAFAEANRRKREVLGLRYNREGNGALFDQLTRYFTRARMTSLARALPGDAHEQRPIFIVGFPRSGTTMVEQILSGHPNIAAGDEIHGMMQLAGAAPHVLNIQQGYPACIDALAAPDGTARAQRLRAEYLRLVRQMGIMEPGKGRFTDKTPLTETHLGLIALTFPEAPIIHLIRHPLNVVLSSHFNDVRHGDHFATSLVDCATHYARTMDLVEHYRSEMALNYLPIRYEEIVADVAGAARQLTAFVGEPWSEGCIDFHLNARQARTASYAQVTEPVYTRSLHRYRNYLPHLQEIVPILRPYLDRWGYTIE